MTNCTSIGYIYREKSFPPIYYPLNHYHWDLNQHSELQSSKNNGKGRKTELRSNWHLIRNSSLLQLVLKDPWKRQTPTIHRRFITEMKLCARGGKDLLFPTSSEYVLYLWSHAATKILLLLLIFLHEVRWSSQKRAWEGVREGPERPDLFQLCVSPIFLHFLLIPGLVRPVQAQPSHQKKFSHISLYNQSLLKIEMQL